MNTETKDSLLSFFSYIFNKPTIPDRQYFVANNEVFTTTQVKIAAINVDYWQPDLYSNNEIATLIDKIATNEQIKWWLSREYGSISWFCRAEHIDIRAGYDIYLRVLDSDKTFFDLKWGTHESTPSF